MIYKSVDVSISVDNLTEKGKELLSKELKERWQATLEMIIPVDKDSGFETRNKSKAVIIVPGGGYSFVANREADPVAIEFLKRNYACFILRYTTDAKFPIPHLEVLNAIRHIRKNVDEYHIDKNKICMIGFSAGGHLVASYSALCEEKELLDCQNICESINTKPNAIILSYPVIDMKSKTHGGSRDIITRGDSYLIDLLSVQNNIQRNYPATFIWSTEEDDIVPIENTYMMDEALTKAKIEHECVVFKHLGHGLSVCNPYFDVIPNDKKEDYAINRTWIDKMFKFLEKVL